MRLLTVKEAADFLRFKNHRSLYSNKEIPRVYAGGRVRFVQEELEVYVKRNKPERILRKLLTSSSRRKRELSR